VAAGALKGDFLVGRASAIGRLDIVILMITIAAIAAAVVYNDREAARFLRERRAPAKLHAWMRAIRAPVRRTESDFKASLAVATLGVGLAVLSRPGRLRTKIWPGPGVSAMAVGAVVEILMIAWHVHLISEGHYWLNPKLTYLVVFGTVARLQYRTTGAILGTWVVLALSTRWRRRPDPLDRLGCFLGYCWIGVMVLEHIVPEFWMP
jgi:hypothetical protein